MKTEDLEIFKAVEDFLDQLLIYTEKMNKTFRHVIGDRLINHTLDILEHIRYANLFVEVLPKRIYYLNLASTKLDAIDTLLAVCVKKRYMPIKSYSVLAKYIVKIGGMTGSWIDVTIKRLVMDENGVIYERDAVDKTKTYRPLTRLAAMRLNK